MHRTTLVSRSLSSGNLGRHLRRVAAHGALACAGWLGGGQIAAAAPSFLPSTSYASQASSPFQGLAFEFFQLENLEDGLLNAPGLIASSGQVAFGAATVDSVDADDGLINGLGNQGRSWWSGPGTSGRTITFNFSNGVLGSFPTHVGLVFTDALGPSVDTATFEVLDATGVWRTGAPTAVGDLTEMGSTADDRFFGAFDAAGLRGMRITMSQSSNFELDHIQYGRAATVVAEPSALVLGSAALVCLAAAGRRRR